MRTRKREPADGEEGGSGGMLPRENLEFNYSRIPGMNLPLAIIILSFK